MYLSLDGTATVYVNSSVAALNALRGTTFDTTPAKAPDREAPAAPTSRRRARASTVSRCRAAAIGGIFTFASTWTTWRQLAKPPPFSWSTYSFKRDGDLFYYRQIVGAPQPDVDA